MIRILIWGTGSRAEQTLAHTLSQSVDIVAFVDSNPAKHGMFHGKPVMAPEETSTLKAGDDYDIMIIASCFFSEIRKQALALGLPEGRIMSAAGYHFLKYADRVSEEQLRALISVPWWYHEFEVLPGVVTPGICGYKTCLLDVSEAHHLTGKRVLDIGAWDGPYTLEMSRRGAEVTGFDIQPSTHSGFDAMCRANGLNARHICENVYNLNPAAHGTYDVVTFFGVYYHLKNPLAAFSNINSVLPVGGLLLVEGAILEGAPQVDAYWADRTDKIELLREEPIACYVKGDFQSEWSNWWVPNMKCLADWLDSSGFEVDHSALIDGGTRAFFVAHKVSDISMEHIVLQSPATA